MESLRRLVVAVASARSGCQGLQGDAGWAGRATLWAATPRVVGGRPCDCPGVPCAEAGVVRMAGRVETEPAALELFAQSLGGDDEVALEATGNALEIARIIEPHVGRVVLANPKAVKGITRAGAKTDKIDARTLAQLLAGGFLPAVWLPDEQTRILRRRISARAQLVRGLNGRT